jgi:hypothetical protein
MLRAAFATLATLVVVAACTAAGGAGGSSSIGPSASPSDGPDQPGSSGGSGLSASIIDPIVADAAARLAVDPSAVTIVSAQAQTFSDGSLGCPKPGEMYTQAIVEGYQVIVEVGGTPLDYRGSGPARFRICETP